MPFRDRIKRVISRRSVSDRASSSAETSSTSSGSTSSTRKFSNPLHSVYGPNEIIPYKYKRPVNKEHKAKLEAYSFAKAWQQSRKNSVTSMGQYSPMGSRLPSRRNSLIMGLRRRNGSVVGIDDEPMPQRRHNLATDALASSSAAGAVGKDFVGSDLERHDTPFTQDQLTLALSNYKIDSPIS